MPRGRYVTEVLPRFESKFIPVTESGCWLWLRRTSPAGYGHFGRKHGSCQAHRVAWELYKGPIPDGMNVCHVCDVRCCVNPDHLFLGTQQDNMRDCWNKGRSSIGSAIRKAADDRRSRTHCKRGHPFSGKNLYIKPNGMRACLACNAISKQKRMEDGRCQKRG